MPWTIPNETRYSWKKPNRGIVVWAIQRALNDTDSQGLLEDGVYGGRTERRVTSFQEDRPGLYVDGVFGPASSRLMAQELERTVTVPLPKGLLHGLVSGESGELIGAVNWQVAGGVDCGYCQRRVYEKDYSNDPVIERAFDGLYQMDLLGDGLAFWHDRYYPMVEGGHEEAWRLATLRHNYPYGADQIAKVGVGGLSPYWRTPQQWVVNIGANFPDGDPVTTPLGWCRHYSLGAPGHDDPGTMTRFVTDWTP